MKLSGKNFFALICDDSKYAPKDKNNRLLCGVYASRKEARDAEHEIKDCVLKHRIYKCSVTVTYEISGR